MTDLSETNRKWNFSQDCECESARAFLETQFSELKTRA